MLSLIGFYTHLGKLLFCGLRRQTVHVIVVDEPNDFCLLLMDDQMIALPAVPINLKAAVGDTFFKSFPGTPFDVVRQAAYFFLSKGC